MGNFSRDTFNEEVMAKLKRYVGVRLQQGVPLVDADWNEMEDIQKHELQAFLEWFIGNGVPKGDDGFCVEDIQDQLILTSTNDELRVSSVEVVNVGDQTAAKVLGFDSTNCRAERMGPTPAQLTGKNKPDEGTGKFDFGSGKELIISIDKSDPITVTLQGPLSPDKVADAINSACQDQGVRLEASFGAMNDFDIKGGDGTFDGAGRCLVKGLVALNECNLKYSSQKLYGNDELAEKWKVPRVEHLLAPDGESRTDLVYLDIWEREITSAEDDPKLINDAIGIETCIRRKQEWAVRVAVGKDIPDYLEDPQPGHAYYPLARLKWEQGEKHIDDLRRKGLAALSEPMTIENGNVGIGTTKPKHKLVVQRNRRPRLVLAENDGDAGVLEFHESKQLRLQYWTEHGGAWEKTLMALDAATEKVGICTTDPGATLDVNGGAFLGYENELNELESFGDPLKSGFYEGKGEIIGDVPDTSHVWTHLITARHHNRNNNHQMQIASTYSENDRLFFRKIRSGSLEPKNPTWNEVATRGQNTFEGNQNFVDGNIGIGAEGRPDVRLQVVGDGEKAIYALNEGHGTIEGVHATVKGLGIEGHVTGTRSTVYADSGVDVAAGTKIGQGVCGHATGDGAGVEVWGVYGYAHGYEKVSKAIGVRGYATGAQQNWAGYFVGDVLVDGQVLHPKPPSIAIDHPLDPFNRTLRHNLVSSPESLCLYRGKVTLDASGEAIVAMPSYFAAFTKEEDATVSVTPIGKKTFLTGYEWNKEYTSFTIFGEPGREVSYLVLADRDDPVMRKDARPVEEEKGNGNFQKGKLLSPESYGYPKEMGVFVEPELEEKHGTPNRDV